MCSAKSLDGFTLWHGPFHSIHKSGKTGKEKGKSCSMKFQILSVDYSIVKDSNADLTVGNWNSKKDP